jgi:DNA mismatch repair ATPase MutS
MTPLADASTAEVIGTHDVMEALNPKSPAGIQLADDLEAWRRDQRPGWRQEMTRTKATDRWARADDGQATRAESVLGEMPRIDGVARTLQTPASRRDPLADVDLFRLKRFLYHGRQLLVACPGLMAAQDVPVDASRKKFAEMLGTLHPDGTDHPRFHLSDALDDELAQMRRRRQEVDERLRQVRDALEDSVTDDLGGTFDIQGAYRPPEDDPELGDDSRLRHTAGAWRVWSEELDALRERRDELDAEIDALEAGCRSELTERFAEEVTWLERMATRFAEADLRLAKVQLRKKLEGCWPEWVCGKTQIRGARHPRILQRASRRGESVQPIDLKIGQQPIILTGPNMGGKSALLRVAGLTQWCAQHALPVPADACQFQPVESIVYVGSEEPHAADIEEGLSSFGREIQRIVEHRRRSTGSGLWLLDEVGRGTHPEDGAELAVAVVETLAREGHRVVAATHFPELAALESAQTLRIRGLDDSETLDEALADAAGDADAVEAALRAAMDYQPEPADGKEIPRDARRVARALGLDLS